MPKTKQAVEQAAKLKLYLPQLDKLESKIHEWMDKEDKYQAMVVRATRYGVPIFEGCYGTSTNDSGVKMDTIFPVASNTKPIIATLILMLQEDGCLELSDPIKKFCPEYTGKGKDEISIWHFLTHTSGIIEDSWLHMTDYIRNELKMELPYGGATEEECDEYNSRLGRALGLPPEDYKWDKVAEEIERRVKSKARPRSVMSYCNHGYQKLKDIICAVTGESIDAYAQRVLFEPLGMIDSHWVLPKEKWDRVLGRGERCMGHGWINSAENYTRESGAGGLKTTVNDMTHFCEMMLGMGKYNNHRILSPASVREMTRNWNGELNPWDAWGLGWNYHSTKVDDAGTLRSERAIDHGGWGGHKILIDPEYNLSVITYMADYEGVQNESCKIYNMVIAACE